MASERQTLLTDRIEAMGIATHGGCPTCTCAIEGLALTPMEKVRARREHLKKNAQRIAERKREDAFCNDNSALGIYRRQAVKRISEQYSILYCEAEALLVHPVKIDKVATLVENARRNILGNDRRV